MRWCTRTLALSSFPSLNSTIHSQRSTVSQLQPSLFIITMTIYCTLLSMLRATLMVASRVPNEGATSGSNAGVVKLSTNRVLYSAKSIHWHPRGDKNRQVSEWDVFWKFHRLAFCLEYRWILTQEIRVLTWSISIWQQSGVKCCRVASVLLRIFRRLHCTVSRAFCSASSLPLSTPPAGFLDGVCGGCCALGIGPGGNVSPFLA